MWKTCLRGVVLCGLVAGMGQTTAHKPLPAAVGKATAEYGAELTKAQGEYAEKVAAANRKYAEALDAAIKAAQKGGDATTAARMQAMKDKAAEDLVVDQSAPRQIGNRIFLSDMEEMDGAVALNGLGKKGRLGDSKIIVGKKYSPNGLGMHPPGKGAEARASFRLNGQFKTFRGGAAINDSAVPGSINPLTFMVLGDNVLLWKSGRLQKGGEMEICNVNVSGVRVLTLVVECPLENAVAHAVWVEPAVLK